MTETRISPDVIRDLGGGLILRHGSPADAEALSDFNSRIHSDDGPDQPEEVVYHWTHDLLARPHPTLAPRDFTVVEEVATGRIVSSCNLIPQTWAYEGIPFGVGRVELVGTLPDYRKRGLIRAQFEVLHRWSAERGHLIQAITGIGYFYRQFGYEMPLNLSGSRSGAYPNIPQLKPGEAEPVRFRTATQADMPFLSSLYDQACARYPVQMVRDESIWRYELGGRTPKNAHFRHWEIIERPDGEALGYLAYPDSLWGSGIFGTSYELLPGVSWLDVTPAVIRRLWAVGTQIAERDSTPEKPRTVTHFGFGLGADHPVYHVATRRLPSINPPYAWYIRIPDLVAFVRHVAPALETRLAHSLAPGYTGELKLNFYRGGLRLIFQGGTIGVEPWPEAHSDTAGASFPAQTFYNLLFCHRTLEEVQSMWPDTWANDTAHPLLNALFPKRPTFVYALG